MAEVYLYYEWVVRWLEAGGWKAGWRRDKGLRNTRAEGKSNTEELGCIEGHERFTAGQVSHGWWGSAWLYLVLVFFFFFF